MAIIPISKRPRDEHGLPLPEVVIRAIDGVRGYKELLQGLRLDSIRGDNDAPIESLDKMISVCDVLLTDLEGWELNSELKAR